MTSLWQERFSPSPVLDTELNTDLLDKAWDWIFEKDSDGQYVRAGLVLILVREKALALRKSGFQGECGHIALLDVYDRYSESKIAPRAIQRAGIPPRKRVNPF